MATAYIKQSNTGPVLKYKLDPETDIAGAAVRFHMKNQDTGVVVTDAAATILVDNPGEVQYAWVGADTVSAGTYDAEFEVTFSGGIIISYPNKGYLKVVMDAKIV